MSICKLTVEIDPSAQSNPLFRNINSFSISDSTLFKHGIMIEQVPSKISSSDFNHLQSKVPSYETLYDKFISVEPLKIVNKHSGDRKKFISEIIGAGVGLAFASKILKINPNRLIIIPKPFGKDKYLDYEAIKGSKKYEIEVKGTINESSIPRMIRDCLNKKGSKSTALRFGAITLARREKDKRNSKLVICDDLEKDIILEDNRVIINLLNYYGLILSFFLDSDNYNSFMRLISSKKIFKTKNSLNKSKIKSRYHLKGKTFFGGFFDRRLIIEDIKKELEKDSQDLIGVFESLTKKNGKIKYFLGIDERIIDLINSNDFKNLLEYSLDNKIRESYNPSIILDSDGIIFVKSNKGEDKQIEEKYPDKKVRSILKLMMNYIKEKTHRCGAPCKSRGIEGKPCDIKTYNYHCHFHR